MKSFGFWIKPDGEVIEMTEPQAHDNWIHRNTSLLGNVGEEALMKGWVSVSFDPGMTQCGIRHREGAIDVRTVKPLRTIIKDYDFLTREVHTDFDKGLGVDVMARLANTSTSHSGKSIYVQYAELRDRMREANKRQYEAEKALLAKRPDVHEARRTLLEIKQNCVSALRSHDLGYEALKKSKSVKEAAENYGFFVGHEASRSISYARDKLQKVVDAVCGVDA